MLAAMLGYEAVKVESGLDLLAVCILNRLYNDSG